MKNYKIPIILWNNIFQIHEGYNALHGPFLKAFPDIGHVIKTAGETDSGQVFVVTVASGTFLGEWAGFQPNGKRWEIPASFLITRPSAPQYFLDKT